MNRKYYIELIGVNGSGKTTLADKLADYFRSRSLSVLELPHPPGQLKSSKDLSHRIPKILRYYTRNPGGVLSCLHARLNPRFGYRGSLHTLLKRRYETGKHLRKKVDVIIQHEGTFQFYRTTGHHFARADRIPGYHTVYHLRRKGYQPVIINLSADLDLVLERCTSERLSVPDPSGWSLAGESPVRLRQILGEWIVKKDKVAGLLRKSGVPVIDISTNKPVNESHDDLVQQIEEVMSKSGSPS